MAICDDHQLMAEGLRSLVDPPCSVVGLFASADLLLKALPSLRPAPDCILLDLSMPGTNGAQALPQIQALSPRAKVVIVTMFSHRVLAHERLRLGAHAFVPKDAPRDELMRAIDTVLAGQSYLSPRIRKTTDVTVSAVPGLERLTRRQIEILRLVAHAMSPGQIGCVLGLSAPTISGHLKLIRNRLGVPSQEGLLKIALMLRFQLPLEATTEESGRAQVPIRTSNSP